MEISETEKTLQKTSALDGSDRVAAEGPAPSTPVGLRYLMLGLLIVGIAGALIFAFVRQTSVKPQLANLDSENCEDPVTENRLRDTLSKSPNDFATLMDWGAYNSRCRKPADYTSAISAFQGATRLADNPANKVDSDNKLEAHLSLGLAYLYNQNFKEAQTEFKTVLAERPKDAFTLLVLGGALIKEDPQQALVYLRQVIEVAPGSDPAKNAQMLINDLTKGSASPSPAPTTPKA